MQAIISRVVLPKLTRSILKPLGVVGFTFDAILENMGIAYCTWKQNRANSQKMLQYVANPPTDPLGIATRLLTLNVPLPIATVHSAFPDEILDALRSMNLIYPGPADTLASDVSLFECKGLLIVTDALIKPCEGFNAVMPLLPECYEFVGSVSRRPARATLDLCTGSGIHALVARRHSERVLATDISSRALGFANFNRWLNRAEEVAFARGDLYAAVGDESFDLILANPPYLPGSDSNLGENYYCGGPTGDAVSSRVIQGLGRHLRVHGLCQMIAGRGVRADRPAVHRLACADSSVPGVRAPHIGSSRKPAGNMFGLRASHTLV